MFPARVEPQKGDKRSPNHGLPPAAGLHQEGGGGGLFFCTFFFFFAMMKVRVTVSVDRR